MSIWAYKDKRPDEERITCARQKTEEKARIYHCENYDDLEPYEKMQYRGSFTGGDKAMYFATQLMLERQQNDCYIRFFWHGRDWELRVSTIGLRDRIGGVQHVISMEDCARNREYAKLYASEFKKADQENRRLGIDPDSNEAWERINEATLIDSGMIEQILDPYHNVVFDYEEYWERTEEELQELENAEMEITDVVIKAEQSEIMIIESGRLLYDLCQLPCRMLRGNINNIPENILEAIKTNIADGNSHITQVPGMARHDDKLKHDGLWTKERHEGQVTGKDYDGREKPFFYTFSTVCQYGRMTKADPELHGFVDIPFSAIPRSLKMKAVDDAYRGAIGSYLDMRKNLTYPEIRDFMEEKFDWSKMPARESRNQEKNDAEKMQKKAPARGR